MQRRRWFRRRSHRERAHRLYLATVRQARLADFYRRAEVPDTVDGRFEMVALHVFLVLRRLKGAERQLAQALYDEMFADMDRNLREMGVGDLSVGKHVKRMAGALHGRIEAYEAGLASDDAALTAALERNLYGTVGAAAATVAAMAAYVRRQAAILERRSVSDIVEGKLCFGLPPDP